MRVYLTSSDPLAAVAISCSLFMIVMTSVIAGSLLPFGFARAGVDPANAGTSIQVRPRAYRGPRMVHLARA